MARLRDGRDRGFRLGLVQHGRQTQSESTSMLQLCNYSQTAAHVLCNRACKCEAQSAPPDLCILRGLGPVKLGEYLLDFRSWNARTMVLNRDQHLQVPSMISP